MSTDNIIREQCIKILEIIPKPFDTLLVAKNYPVLYTESMNTVL